MKLRFLLLALLLLLGGLTALLALQWRLGVGGAVVSPQKVELPLEKRLLVAGGRAGLELLNRSGERAEVAIRCTAGERWVKLRVGQTSDEVCSIRVRLIEFTIPPGGTLASSQAHLEVTWGDPRPAEVSQ